MLTAAVIGCGHGGGLSLDALHGSVRYQPIAAADPSAAARHGVADRFPDVRAFADFHEMLADCPSDVVCIATPAPSHASIAREVLGHQPRGLLLEKPLAPGVSTAETLLREVRDAGCPAVVPHGLLVLPATQEVKARIRRGDIGNIVSVEVQNAVDLLNAGIHWLVYLIDVFDNDRPTSVTARFDVSDHVVNDGVQVESIGTTTVELQSGIRITLHSGRKTIPSSSVLPPEEQQGALFLITGSEGVIEFSAWAGSYWIQRGKSDGVFVKQSLPAGVSYHRLFLEQLADNIAEGKPKYRSAELSLAALKLIETAYRQQGESEWQLGVPAEK